MKRNKSGNYYDCPSCDDVDNFIKHITQKKLDELKAAGDAALAAVQAQRGGGGGARRNSVESTQTDTLAAQLARREVELTAREAALEKSIKEAVAAREAELREAFLKRAALQVQATWRLKKAEAAREATAAALAERETAVAAREELQRQLAEEKARVAQLEQQHAAAVAAARTAGRNERDANVTAKAVADASKRIATETAKIKEELQAKQTQLSKATKAQKAAEAALAANEAEARRLAAVEEAASEAAKTLNEKMQEMVTEMRPLVEAFWTKQPLLHTSVPNMEWVTMMDNTRIAAYNAYVGVANAPLTDDDESESE